MTWLKDSNTKLNKTTVSNPVKAVVSRITRGVHNASYQITQKYKKLNRVFDTKTIDVKRKPKGGCVVYMEYLLILLTLATDANNAFVNEERANCYLSFDSSCQQYFRGDYEMYMLQQENMVLAKST